MFKIYTLFQNKTAHKPYSLELFDILTFFIYIRHSYCYISVKYIINIVLKHTIIFKNTIQIQIQILWSCTYLMRYSLYWRVTPHPLPGWVLSLHDPRPIGLRLNIEMYICFSVQQSNCVQYITDDNKLHIRIF